jgi:DNA-binding transcriptional ArsR family regulator
LFQKSRTLMVATARELPHPDIADVAITDVLFALSDPARLELVRLLAAEGPQSVANCQVIDPDAPKSTFSHHLKALREAGVVRNEPSGRQRMISLRRDELEIRYPGLLDSILGGDVRREA